MSTATEARKKKRRQTVIGAGLVFAFFIAVLVSALILANLRRADEQLLVEARKSLTSAAMAKESRDRMQLAHHAKDKLQQYVDGRGQQQASGKLLLAAAIFVEGRLDQSAGAKFGQQAATLIDEADLSQCSTDDLLLASELFAKSGSLPQAQELVEVALGREGQREQSLGLAIDIHHDLGHEEETLELCDELSKLNPDKFHPWQVRVRIHENQGYPEKMVDDYRKIIELFPDRSPPYRLRLIERLIEVGDRAGAKQQFEILEQQAPELIAQQPIVLAKIKHLEGEADRAAEILALILKNEPKHPDALLLQGRIQLAKNELDAAVASLEKLLELRPTDTQGNYLLGQAFARLDEKEKAEQHFEVHKQVLSTRVKIHSLERQFGRNQANPELAEQIAEQYELINAPEHADFWRGLASQIRQGAN